MLKSFREPDGTEPPGSCLGEFGAIYLLAAFLVVAPLVHAPTPAQETEAESPSANKGRALIDLAVEALGGETYLNATAIIRQGRYYSFSRGELASPGERFIDYLKLPDKERMEFGKKGKIVYVNNGDLGWELDPQGIREQTPEAIADFQESIRRDFELTLRRRRDEPGMQFYYLGTQLADNRRVHIVEMVDAENESLFFYLDARTRLPTQLRYRERDVLTSEMVEVVEYYGKYVRVEGIQTPLQITRTRAGLKVFEVFLNKVQYTASVPDSLFTRASLEERWRKIKD